MKSFTRIILFVSIVFSNVAFGTNPNDHSGEQAVANISAKSYNESQSTKKSDNGTTRIHYITVSVDQPYSLIADAGEDVSIESGESTVIGGSPSADLGYGNYTYQWTPSDYLDDPNSPNPIASPPVTTVYELIVTDGNHCTSQSFIQVKVVQPEPILEFFINEESFVTNKAYAFCFGEEITIHLSEIVEGTPPFDITININSDENHYTAIDKENPQLYKGTPDPGIYSIVFTYIKDSEGVEVESPESDYHATLEILDLPSPEIAVEGDLEFCDGGVVMLTASEADGYLWSNGATTQSIAISEGGTFTATLTGNNGCQNVTEQIEVLVHPLPEVTCPDNISLGLHDAGIELPAAFPSGGTFSGEGVSDGHFDPSVPGEGIWMITYEYQDETTGCSNSCTFEIEVFNDTGIPDRVSKDIHVYPNPANSVLHIEASRIIRHMNMYNIQGQVVYSATVNNDTHKFNVETLKQGIYLIQVLFDDGASIQKVQIYQSGQ